jgi:chemotaxis protein MotD
LPSVAPDSPIHHSSHPNSSLHNSRPLPTDSKAPATPFSLLLDSTSDAAPPPPRPEQPNHAASPRSSRADDQHTDKAPDASPNPADGKATQATDGAGHADQPHPEATVTAKLLGGDPGADTEKSKADAKDSKDQAAAAAAPTTQPAATMMQQVLADATAVPAADAAQLAALKAAEKSAGAQANAAADDQDGSQADSTAAGGQPAAAAAIGAAATSAAEAQAKHGATEAAGEATRTHVVKPGHADDQDERPGDIAKLADFDAHLAQATADAKATPGGPPALGAAQPADRAAAAAAAATPGPATPAAVPLAAVGIEIAARAQSGGNRFEIRLDPPELGRIDVRLDVDRDGHVTSRLVVDRPETLDALRRDAPDLERALQQAGLKTSDNGLQFSLRDQSFAGRDQSFQQQQQQATPTFVADSELGPSSVGPAAYGRVLRAGGLDISV